MIATPGRAQREPKRKVPVLISDFLIHMLAMMGKFGESTASGFGGSFFYP